MSGETPAPCHRTATVTAWRGARVDPRADLLAEEVAVALVVDGISQAVMLASPADLEDFALGFALTEGWIDRADALRSVEVVPVTRGIELRLELPAAAIWKLKARRRTLAGRTGCGLCGTDSLDQVERPLDAVHAIGVHPDTLEHARAALSGLQPEQALTGATHAAAWCSAEGAILCLREDVGRHNALDKLIGAMARAGLDPRRGFVMVTSRASFEMVQKTASAGIGMLVALSAPTARAVSMAEACGLALAGFVREGSGVAYTQPARFGLAGQAAGACA